MPSQIVIDLSSAEQTNLRKQMRRLRLLCPLLRLPILLLLGQHRSPTEIADWLLCSRSSVYEAAACWHQGWRPWPISETENAAAALPFAPSLRRSFLALLRKLPQQEGWCRTRWSCDALALSLEAHRGFRVSAETVRRWLPALGWRWKRTKLATQENDGQRAGKLAHIRLVWEILQPRQALLFADELDIHLLSRMTSLKFRPRIYVHVLVPPTQAGTAITSQALHIMGFFMFLRSTITMVVFANLRR